MTWGGGAASPYDVLKLFYSPPQSGRLLIILSEKNNGSGRFSDN